MSESTKRSIQYINGDLRQARESVNAAAVEATRLKDKVLADKIAANAASLKDTADYIKSRTNEEA